MTALPARPAAVDTLDRDSFFAGLSVRYRPAVLRGAALDWPLVLAAGGGRAAVERYLTERDTGAQAETFMTPAQIGGRFSYGPDFRGFNFERRGLSVSRLLAALADSGDHAASPTLYMGSVAAETILRDFAADHPLAGLPQPAPPRLWIGNRSVVSAHYDLSDNVAVVAAGRRRFTLFPPEQLENLYVGPLDHTVAGQPISMVDIDAPDLERFPLYASAAAAAVTADLEPGDAIYIPALWWHHVRASSPLNVLVNYWWDMAPAGTGTAFEALIHAVLGLRELPPERRDAFKAMFDHYVFNEADPVDHIPEGARGVLGAPGPETRRRMRMFLAEGLARALRSDQG